MLLGGAAVPVKNFLRGRLFAERWCALGIVELEVIHRKTINVGSQ